MVMGAEMVASSTSNPTSNPFYNAAITKFGSLSGADAAENNAYDVNVLNLTCQSGGAAAQRRLESETPHVVFSKERFLKHVLRELAEARAGSRLAHAGKAPSSSLFSLSSTPLWRRGPG
jgi:hypothetical protein